MKFSELGIHPALLRELDARGYAEPTQVQQAILEEQNASGDLLVSSRTGSGKTVAFGLAVARLLLSDDERRPLLHGPGPPRVLVVAPTRELALQVARELSWLYRGTGARVTTCVGGMDVRREQRTLRDGAHVVVGTPGRLCDHLERGALSLEDLEAVVLDEADEMLDLGFEEELQRILEAAPKERRTLMFSATLPKEIEALARRYTASARRVRASAIEEPHADIEYLVHLVAPRERELCVVNVLRFHEPSSALVFVATREAVFHLHAGLVERGFAAVALSGELSQAERNRSLVAMRDGRARVLVATDVAARGLDLPSVSLVVHADPPGDRAGLLHRSGRTGRAGRKGKAVVLVPFQARGRIERMFSAAGIDVAPTPAPMAEQIRALDQVRLVEKIGTLLGDIEPEDREVAALLLARFPAESLASALARTERRALPAAEELPQTASLHAKPSRSARPTKPVRAERPGRPERPMRGERPERAERPERSERSERSERPERPERPGAPAEREGVWFRVNVGRERNADPRWLLPMLCRRGKVKKGDIGLIEIRARETRFQVSPRAAQSFGDAAARPDAKDPKIKIEPV